MADIAHAGSGQEYNIGEVSGAVTEMDSMTQQNAALVEQAAATADAMQGQAQELIRMVEHWASSGRSCTRAPTLPGMAIRQVLPWRGASPCSA